MGAAVMLSDVAEIVMGQSPPSTCYNDAENGLPFYQGKTDFGATYPTPRIYCSDPKKLAEEGDILISVRAPVGATNLCKSRSCIGRGIAAIRAHGIDRDFLYFYLRKIEAYIDSLGSGAIFKAINKSQLAELPINEAGLPLPEQQKIAHILSTVQRAIEAQERIIQTTTELKKALMHKLFTEGLRGEPQKQTEIGPVPESWEVVRLKDVCHFQSGGTPSKQNPEFWQGTIPWVSPKDMKRPRLNDVEDHISEEALESGSKLAPAGSVFVVVRGMILAKTVPVALAEVPMAINQDMKAIVPGAKLRSDFLLYALEAFRQNLCKKVGRSGHGTCTLMGHEVAAFKIPLPDLKTQEAIASTIQNLERKKELHEEKRTQLQDLFHTLLHELMTAKTSVSEKSFSPAS
jgi:type I restriction enzyme S subunit